MSFIFSQWQEDFFILSLNRPETLNSFNLDMIIEMKEILDSLKSHSHLRALILKGEGKSFSTGADLKWVLQLSQLNFEQIQKKIQNLYELLLSLSQFPMPVLAQVHGYVMGGALGLVSCCDIVFSENSTVFALSEVKVGLAPALISPFLKMKLSYSHLCDLFLSGRRFNSQEAKEMGLVKFYGTFPELENSMSLFKTQLQENDLAAMKTSKALLKGNLMNDPQFEKDQIDLMEKLSGLFAERLLSEETKTRLMNFSRKFS